MRNLSCDKKTSDDFRGIVKNFFEKNFITNRRGRKSLKDLRALIQVSRSNINNQIGKQAKQELENVSTESVKITKKAQKKKNFFMNKNMQPISNAVRILPPQILVY